MSGIFQKNESKKKSEHKKLVANTKFSYSEKSDLKFKSPADP